jgi:hypothetical protein
MPLTQLSVEAKVEWTLSAANAGRKPSTQGPDSISFSTKPATGTYNEVFETQLTFTAGTLVQTIDLRAFTNRLGAAVVLAKVLGLIMKATGAAVSVTAGASNGLAWKDRDVEDGGVELMYQPTPKTVDATHKTLKFTAVLSPTIVTATLDVCIIGGT